MKRSNRILALLLAFVMVASLFAGIGTEAKAAGVSLDGISLSTNELTKEGGIVTVTCQMDEFSAEEGTVYVRLRKATDEFNGTPIYGDDPILIDEEQTISRTNPTFTVEIPANESDAVETYQVSVKVGTGRYDKHATLKVTLEEGVTEEPGDRTELDARIEELKKMDHSLYTDASWNEVKAAVKEAEELKEGATEKEITAALDKIEAAVANLVKLPSWGPHLISLSANKMGSKGGPVIVSLVLDDLGAEEGTIWYRLRKKDNSAPADQPAWITVATDVEVTISKEDPTFEVEIPANTTEQEEIYQIAPTNRKGNYTNVGTAKLTVIPASQDEEFYKDKVLSDRETFRILAVDEDGKPVEGLNFVAVSEDGKATRTFTTNEKGVASYTIDQISDYGVRYDVKVAENQAWSSDEEHSFTVNTMECHLSISQIDGVSLAKAGEVRVVVKKNEIQKPETLKVSSVSLSKTSYVYNGKVQKPSIVAKNNKGQKIASKNYTVKYSTGCKNVGKYTVKITFKGDYKGTYTKTYKILPKGTSLSSVKADKKSFKATWKKQSTQTTGYQIQYSTSKSFSKNTKTTTVSSNKTLNKTVKKLTSKKTYYVRVRTYKTVKENGKNVKYYSAWSSAKSVKVK